MVAVELLQVFSALVILYILSKFVTNRVNRNRLPLPPGPKGLPLVGNIKDLPGPGDKEYLHWLKHRDTYGPISSVTVLGQTIIIIHDKNLASELMEKRAPNHSGRPVLVFGMQMCGWDEIMSMWSYNPAVKLSRKLMYQELGSKSAVSEYYPLQETVVGHFLWRASRDKGENLTKNLKTEAAELILKATYGYDIEPHKNDPLVDLVGEAMENFSEAMVPGKWVVDILPVLKYLPDWAPGAGFKKTARVWKKTLMRVINVPYEYVKFQRSHSTAGASFVSRILDERRNLKEQKHQTERELRDLSKEDEQMLKMTAASLYLAGADTTVQSLRAFFLAMAMYPDVQHKAQEEIDRVIGSSPTRLPTFTDREHLPYIRALVEEAQRWHPVTLMGLTHATEKEDSINGYRIPKGALLLPAVWWFTRDPSVYHNPEEFIPERFSEPYNEPYATNVTFGFGRRICPGRVFADASLFLTMVQVLSVFDIKKPLDEAGNQVELQHEFSSGIIAYPGPFKVRLTPRSKAHELLIEKFIEEHPWPESDANLIEKMMMME
ncbi:cytochrome protein [Delitschia confertaspora ATCC 74209]|uniref:Cytochrome protein n=1 Tax=Delitschia confertaspora ATCC 74209 TaxID=1513339 RepID=A0A9P4JLF8_9PLEO|nr:cytochrome protein [Delitschia confertaspora ATCC 74209]